MVSTFKSALNYGDIIVDIRSHLCFSQWWKMEHATCRFQTCAHCWIAAQ